jgi:hypothetical protein
MRNSFRAGLVGTVVAGLCVAAGTAGATPPRPGVTGTIIAQKTVGDHVHIGRNLGDTPVVLDVLYVLPHGSALPEDAPNPGCDFQ